MSHRRGWRSRRWWWAWRSVVNRGRVASRLHCLINFKFNFNGSWRLGLDAGGRWCGAAVRSRISSSRSQEDLSQVEWSRSGRSLMTTGLHWRHWGRCADNTVSGALPNLEELQICKNPRSVDRVATMEFVLTERAQSLSVDTPQRADRRCGRCSTAICRVHVGGRGTCSSLRREGHKTIAQPGLDISTRPRHGVCNKSETRVVWFSPSFFLRHGTILSSYQNLLHLYNSRG